jgi:hypothetical protein
VKTTTSHISANIRFHVTGDVANISATMRSVHKCNKKGIMTSTVTLSIFSVIGRLSCQVHSSARELNKRVADVLITSDGRKTDGRSEFEVELELRS